MADAQEEELMSKEFRLGIFIVGTLLALGAGVFLIGGKQMLFSSTYTVKAGFSNGAGLDNAAEVRVGGIRKGTVKGIDLPKRPEGKVTGAMTLHSSTKCLGKQDP